MLCLETGAAKTMCPPDRCHLVEVHFKGRGKQTQSAARCVPKSGARLVCAGARRNITRMPAFRGFDPASPDTVVFEQGLSAAGVDCVVYATGYSYYFPFLDGTGLVTVERNRVSPLYQHVWPPEYAPNIAFLGIPWKVGLR